MNLTYVKITLYGTNDAGFNISKQWENLDEAITELIKLKESIIIIKKEEEI